MRRSVGRMITPTVLIVLIGCAGTPETPPVEVPSTPTPAVTATAATVPSTSTPAGHGPSPRVTASDPPSQQPGRPSAQATLTPDPRNRFYTDDRTRYASPWYQGTHRIMIEYGCTEAPYYASDPRCGNGHGFHHGIDIALPCGAEIRAGRPGRVLDPATPGTPGPAYGRTAFRIRTRAGDDVLIGHPRRVFVEPGDRVRRGQRIALAGARGAPDGCHLHLEVRSAGGGLDTARHPRRIIALRPE